ncbi:hypothetical protein NB688_000581 [Xanthomonas sacchari]|uniref:DUF2514 domain-containing protein n=1 Tax=Xanthomonas sacchari TaxID=56458 RepID=A0ABT3DTN8_9XANT|nr:hypothetical protein [Xanthomonas sacchari]MCW0398767.1 hypothetical protein [Xanthomonas sacchari]MCW0418415.1 hypothetical protein [Xanthomonas sacchari]UYK72522.1 hypothetical protein NG828_20435 [Xanthomonas sacchari]
MSLIDSFAVKPLLITAGVLLAVAIGEAGALAIQHYTHASALAVCTGEAEAWRVNFSSANTRVQELSAANAGYGETVSQLQAALKEAQEQTTTIRQQSNEALAAAQAQADEADRTLKTFMTRYAAQVKETTCAQALLHVEAACPALTGY